MPRYFMHLSYRGAPFHGWQRQPNASSVQQTIEEALATVLRHTTPIVGAGRTDTGVNARSMVAHFDSPTIIINQDTLLRSLNTIVGPNIAIHSMKEVHDDAHARFDATSRTYRYFVTHRKSPFLYDLAWHCKGMLDYDAMNTASGLLLETDDFTSFSKLHTDVKTNICNVTHAQWSRADMIMGDCMMFEITADRFLRNMVRAVVGTLVDVGRHKISIDRFHAIILERNRCSAGISMPAHALYLWDVKYPFIL